MNLQKRYAVYVYIYQVLLLNYAQPLLIFLDMSFIFYQKIRFIVEPRKIWVFLSLKTKREISVRK